MQARHVALKVPAAKHRVLNVRLGRFHPPGLQAVVFAIPGSMLVLMPRSAWTVRRARSLHMPRHRHVKHVQQVSSPEGAPQCALGVRLELSRLPMRVLALVVIVVNILLLMHQCAVNAPRGSTAQTQTPLRLRHARTATQARHVALKVPAAKHCVLIVRLGRFHPPGLQAVVIAIPGNMLALLLQSA